jgi:gamma-glutamyltranspeptidase/glutathione hydrolase
VDGDELQPAIDRPRVHHQWRPDELLVEPGALTEEVAAALAQRGHTIRTTARLGEVHAARRRADGSLEAAADRRGPGAATAALASR